MAEGNDERPVHALSTVGNTPTMEHNEKDNRESPQSSEPPKEPLPPGTTFSNANTPLSAVQDLASSAESDRVGACINEPSGKNKPQLSVWAPCQTSTDGNDNPDSLGERDLPRPNTLLVDYSNSHSGNYVDFHRYHDVTTSDVDLFTGSFVPHSKPLSETLGIHRLSTIRKDLPTRSSSRRKRLKTVLIVGAQLIVALLLTLLFLAALLANNSLRKYRYRSPIKAADVCSNAACEMVATVLVKSAELSVSPCKDFYRHSCGRWHAGNHHRPSYISENSIAFRVRVKQSLQALASDRRLADFNSHRMAIFYASCELLKLEHRQPKVEHVIGLSGINVTVWLGARSFQQLFATIVAQCVRSGFASVITTQRSGLLVYVDSGKSIVRTMEEKRDKITLFMEATFLALNMELNDSSKMAIETLDSALDDALVSAFSQFQPTTVGQLPTRALQLAWLEGLNGGLQNRSVVRPDTLVLSRNLHIVRRVIWILSSVELYLASAYCLLLSLSQIMRYAYILGGARADRRGNDFCLVETAERFPGHFPRWMAQTMETSESRDYVKVMVSTLGEVASKHPDVLHGLRLNTTQTPQFWKVNASIIADVTEDPPGETGPPMEFDDFLTNVIRLSAEGHEANRNSWRRLSTQQLKGSLEYDGVSLVLPTMQLTGDLLHAEAAAPMLDYSTVGVRILVEWAHILLEKHPALSAQMSAYRNCTKERTDDDLPDGDVPEKVLRWMLFVPWALDVALVAAQTRSSTSTKDAHARSRNQLFFRRFCQTTCGDSHAAAVCSYGTRHSRMFASAFGCRQVSTLAC